MKKLKISIIIGIITLAISLVVNAGEEKCKVMPDFSSDILVIEGKANTAELITIMVFEDGTTPQNYLSKISLENIKNTVAYGDDKSFDTVVFNGENIVSCVDDVEADASGLFSHTFRLKKTDVYDVYLLYSDSAKLEIIEDVNFISSIDYNSEIDKLNGMDKNTFIDKLTNSETIKLFGFEDELNENVSLKEVAEIFYASIDNGKLKNDYKENEGLYKLSVAIATLNKGEKVDFEYLDYCYSNDKALSDFKEKYNDSDKIINYVLNKNIKDTNELIIKLKEIALLMIVENPDGYENIKKAFENYKEVTKISTPTSKNKVYAILAGKKFNSVDELVSAYKSTLSEEGGNSSGGGGGGGSAGGSNKLDVHTVQPSESEPDSPETINKNIFDDLDSVTWAQEAIVNLAAKGVINGKSDKVFAPNDYITRAEFTKLVVAALANHEATANISFSDVSHENWAYPYIAKAKNAGIINGYTDTLFGATDLITRQDMSVIIYNAAKYKQIKLEKGDNALLFADDNNISDYAKEAVYTLRNMAIVNGTDETHFEPKSYASRAQAAVMLYRLLLK